MTEPPNAAAVFPPARKLDDGEFELGLVLGGTVSAGAYTAGALDFLLEAIEAWNRNPLHKVIMKTASGSSGGAVCAAILGLLSGRRVAHVTRDPTAPGQIPVATGNPLWDLWVNDFQIEGFLDIDDLAANADEGTDFKPDHVQHVPSLLNCGPIDRARATLAELGNTTEAASLPYFDSPFRVAITLTNLRGIPYKIQNVPTLGPNSGTAFSGTAYVQHDDFAWFAFPNGAITGKRADEFWLDPENVNEASGIVNYGVLAAYAAASGAMPIGLAARTLTRPTEHYNYRPKVRPTPTGYEVDWPQPDWETLQDPIYKFTAVDGGTFNNDPVSLAHRALTGLVGINPRGKSDAKRAILMIDPLADRPKPLGPTGASLYSVANSIVGTFVSGGRYLTADMELFAKDDVFSRFQLVPFRPSPNPNDSLGVQKIGAEALSGTSLYAAAGWCSRDFRVHDYLLGRQNMQLYLQREFKLAGDNPLFISWNFEDRKQWALNDDGDHIQITETTEKSTYFLPIIPDKTGPLQQVPNWPYRKYNPDSLKPLLKKRLDAVLGKLVSDNNAAAPWWRLDVDIKNLLHGNASAALPWFLGMFAVPGVVDFVEEKVIYKFEQELKDAFLWP